MISGIVTAVLLVSFIGISIWAYSSHPRERFRQAAQLPLDDEPARPCCCAGKERQP